MQWCRPVRGRIPELSYSALTHDLLNPRQPSHVTCMRRSTQYRGKCQNVHIWSIFFSSNKRLARQRTCRRLLVLLRITIESCRDINPTAASSLESRYPLES